MLRRHLLIAPWAALGGRAWAGTDTTERLATAWRTADAGADSDHGHHVGVLQLDGAAGQLRLAAQLPVPSRAHGLLALADGGFLALANRPGRWLLRCDAQGLAQRWHRLDDEVRTLNGHAAASADGQWLYTTETDPATGLGWIAVRDARTLARVAEFESHGIDPHQLLTDTEGQLLVAHGGIARDALGRKRPHEPMSPSLVRLRTADGALHGRWTLPDSQLSIRHLAWSPAAPLLGVALQAEHADPRERAAAPTLAVWDGQHLQLPTADARAAGYAGDIAAGPGGGFVISAQKQGLGLWWQPAQPQQLTLVAQLTEPCALVASTDGEGVLIGAARGLAQWHRTQPARMLRWPVPLAPDNHAVRLLPPV